MLIELCEMFIDSDNLLNVRHLTTILIGYSGFFKFDKLSSITYNDVEVKDSYLFLNIRKSKTDQYRQGNQIRISKDITSACPYAMFNIFFGSPGSNHFLFRQIFRSGGVSK
ncbi:LOW QUALITY PROTEIN: hypothetical protein KUTeg_008200 [Tegillarca granosa]|uniref:Uncharacterized protein n=1 Tax=Tegillarca granosa TaxID=220873 RepID=A0ABQ9F8F3_TEGGR|nr:LOW QUALITY PROTEIN: hypothetical protein KUTeg_008200 [Tegillarca granosa]